jgi:hypothetical protein
MVPGVDCSTELVSRFMESVIYITKKLVHKLQFGKKADLLFHIFL